MSISPCSPTYRYPNAVTDNVPFPVNRHPEIHQYHEKLREYRIKGNIAAADDLFLQAKELGYDEVSLYSNYMLVHQDNYPFVQNIFKEMLERPRQPNIYTYNILIQIAGKHEKWNKVDQYFNQMIDEKKASDFTFINYLNAKKNQVDLAHIKGTRTLAIQHHAATPHFYTNYLCILVETGNLEEACNTFAQLDDVYKIGDNDFMAQALRAYAGEGSVHLAQHLAQQILQLAQGTNTDTSYMYTACIELAIKAQNYAAATQILLDAKTRPCFNEWIYNTYIHRMGQSGHIEEAETQFNEAIQSTETSSSITYGVMIDIWIQQQKNGEKQKGFEKVRQILALAKKNGCSKDTIYACAIQSAGIAEQLQSVWGIFKEAMQSGYHKSTCVLDCLARAACPLGDTQKIKKIFVNIFDSSKVDKRLYHSYFHMMHNAKEYKAYDAAFRQMVNKGLANAQSYHFYITHLLKRKAYAKIKSVFTEAHQKGLLTTNICNLYIWAMREAGDFDAAANALSLAIQTGCHDVHTHIGFIRAAQESKQWSKAWWSFEHALKIQEQAQGEDQSHASAILYEAIIQAAWSAGEVEKAEKLTKEARKQGIHRLPIFSLTRIRAEGKKLQEQREDVEKVRIKARKVLDLCMEALQRQIAYPAIYPYWLEAVLYGNEEDFKRIFDVAIADENIDAEVYAQLVHTAHVHGDLEAAQRAFDRAKERDLLSIQACSYLIQAAEAHGEVECLRKAFVSTPQQQRSHPDIYHSYIRAVAHCGRREEAYRAFAEGQAQKVQFHAATYALIIKIAGDDRSLKKGRAAFTRGISAYPDELSIYHAWMYTASRCCVLTEVQKAYETAVERGLATSTTEEIHYRSVHKANAYVPIGSICTSTLVDLEEAGIDATMLSKGYWLFKLLKEIGAIDPQGKVTRTVPLPAIAADRKAKLQEVLSQVRTFVPHRGELNTCRGSWQELIAAIETRAKVADVAITYKMLVGGGAAWILGAAFYWDTLTQLMGKVEHPLWDTDTQEAIENWLVDTLTADPNDWDFKILLNSKEIALVSEAIEVTLAKNSGLPADRVRDSYFSKRCLVSKEGNLYTIHGLADADGDRAEWVIGHRFARPKLLTRDPPPILLHGKTPAITGTPQEVTQSVVDYVTRRLDASSPSQINAAGWSTYLARIAQGLCTKHTTLRTALCEKVSILSPQAKMDLLNAACANHCGGDTGYTLAMLFQAYADLCEEGNADGAAALYLIGATSLPPPQHPLLRTLAEVWLQGRDPCTFQQVSALLTTLALFYLLPPAPGDERPSDIHCVLDEHEETAVLQLSIDGKAFLLPLDPTSAFEQLEEIASHASLSVNTHLYRLFCEGQPPNGFSFATQMPAITQPLAFSIDDLTVALPQWPKMQKACAALQQALQPTSFFQYVLRVLFNL